MKVVDTEGASLRPRCGDLIVDRIPTDFRSSSSLLEAANKSSSLCRMHARIPNYKGSFHGRASYVEYYKLDCV